jgi:hypothetical protein
MRKVTEGRSRIRRWIQIHKSEVRIRIQIRTKMSRIPNTVNPKLDQRILLHMDPNSQTSNGMKIKTCLDASGTGTHLCSSCQRTWCPGPAAHCASVAAASSPPSPSPPTFQGSHPSEQWTMYQMGLCATYWTTGKTSKWNSQAMDEEFKSSKSILKMGKMRITKPWLRRGARCNNRWVAFTMRGKEE